MAFPVCGGCFSDCADCWGLCSCEDCQGMHPHDKVSAAGKRHAAFVKEAEKES